MKQFKIGDRVVFTSEVSPDWWFKSGQTGIIVDEFHPPRYRYAVRVENVPCTGRVAYVGKRHIALVQPNPQPASSP